MITNCPNCGAPLDKVGHCSYCETNVVPNFDIFEYGSSVELNITVIDRCGNSFTIPLRGCINGIESRSESTAVLDFSGENLLVREKPILTFTFEGGIRDDDN